MDNLVLIRVAASLDRGLKGYALRGLRQESPRRYRLIFEREEAIRSVLLSLRPERPWIGRPVGRSSPSRQPLRDFASVCSVRLRGHVLDGVEKLPVDRTVGFRFASGTRLVVELLSHAVNAVLLDDASRVVATARRPRSQRERLVPGAEYRSPPLPTGRLDPFGASVEAVDAALAGEAANGRAGPMALSRALLGVGIREAELVFEECRRAGRSPGGVVVERLAALLRGELDPVIEADEDPWEAAASGRLGASNCRLFAWAPVDPPIPPRRRIERERPEETAGLFHEALERDAELRERTAGLVAILDAELRRAREAIRRTEADVDGFREPERFRRWGEALLAGLAGAERRGESVWVPDPYDLEQRPMAIPVEPGSSLQEAADALFRKHRRARRGIEQGRRRLELLAQRRERIERLRQRSRESLSPPGSLEIEREMRGLGIPVGLAPARKAGRAVDRGRRPRLEGVRVVVSDDGMTILVGRSAKDNHRLTFKLAGPEDFWFHAAGVSGAHVVVRNDEKQARPPRRTLEQAAALAAWYSDAQCQPLADVSWTRRKYVRKPRGAPPGTVRLKRFETVRVRPAPVGAGLAAGPRIDPVRGLS